MKKFLVFAALIVSATWVVALSETPASAAYNSNNLMSDGIFTEKNSMNASQIQSFLNARGSGLRNYSQGGRSAAQIIYQAAQDYGVNPRVIMATLQKEQSLITNPNPSEVALRSAMGYACPTNGTCEERFRGFANQVDNGVWQLRLNYERARGNNTWWNPAIGYACGGSTHFYSPGLRPGNRVTFRDGNGYAYATITIANAATAALYCYTPHVYNPSGNGQYYSGSYNFVMFYERWWGPTTGNTVTSSSLTVARDGNGQAYTNKATTVRFTVTNHTNSAIDVGQIGVAVRGPNGENMDLPMQRANIGAWQTVTYSRSFQTTLEGSYRFFMTSYKDGQWREDYPPGINVDVVKEVNQVFQAQPQLIQQTTFNTDDMRQGKNFEASFKIKNPSSTRTAKVGRVMLAVRGPNNVNRDMPLVAVPDLAPGAEFEYKRSAAWTSAAGSYRTYISTTPDNGKTWNESDFALPNGISRTVNVNLKPSPTMTEGVQVDTQPHVGSTGAISFKIRNYGSQSVNLGQVGVTVRSPSGKNKDPKWEQATIPAGQTYTYTGNVTFDEVGSWRVAYSSTKDGRSWSNAQPVLENNNIKKTLEVATKQNPTVTQSVSLSKPNPRVGERVTVTYGITNFSNQPVSIGTNGIAARDSRGRNSDPGWENNVTIAAGATWTYSKQVVFRQEGRAKLWISNHRSGQGWRDNYPTVESSSVQRSLEVTVLPSPTITQGLSVSGTPKVGQVSTLTFTVRNYGSTAVEIPQLGVSLRSPSQQNRDPRWSTVSIPAGETYEYSAPVTFTQAGVWTAKIESYQQGKWHANLPQSESGGITRQLSINVAP